MPMIKKTTENTDQLPVRLTATIVAIVKVIHKNINIISVIYSTYVQIV